MIVWLMERPPTISHLSGGILQGLLVMFLLHRAGSSVSLPNQDSNYLKQVCGGHLYSIILPLTAGAY